MCSEREEDRKRYQDVSLDALIHDGRQLGEPATENENVAEADEAQARILHALRIAIREQLTDKQRAIDGVSRWYQSRLTRIGFCSSVS
ncbi:MAG: hypothetical protein ABIS50_15940 [Luteolibacter sp.]|uniref:hypothetical protein n=1 Tax=Luteolibacter sp. TaxID=1962973 RepID=UPI003266925E